MLKRFCSARKGVTILEFLIWTGLVAVVLGGVGIYSLTARNQSKMDATITEIGQIRSIVDSIYPSQNYASLTANQVAQSMPASLVQGTAPSMTILDPWGGLILVEPDPITNYFWEKVKGVPRQACIALALTTFNGNITDFVYINNTYAGQPATMTTAQTLCNSANNNSFEIRFN